jgi:hypothetical protein
MPFETVVVPARVFMTFKGVTVFHTYKDDEIGNGPLAHSFVLDKYHNYNNSFDVRELPGWGKIKRPPYLIGENNTEENKGLWAAWHAQKKELDFIKKMVKIYINNLLKQGYVPEDLKRIRAMHNSVQEIC